MEKKISATQRDADNLIAQYLKDKEALKSVEPEHGIPLRMDSINKENHWKFLDRFILKTK